MYDGDPGAPCDAGAGDVAYVGEAGYAGQCSERDSLLLYFFKSALLQTCLLQLSFYNLVAMVKIIIITIIYMFTWIII